MLELLETLMGKHVLFQLRGGGTSRGRLTKIDRERKIATIGRADTTPSIVHIRISTIDSVAHDD